MKDIVLYGSRDFIMKHIPPVTVQLWDKDMLVSIIYTELTVVLASILICRRRTTSVSFKLLQFWSGIWMIKQSQDCNGSKLNGMENMLESC